MPLPQELLGKLSESITLLTMPQKKKKITSYIKQEVTKNDLITYLVHKEGLTEHKAKELINRVFEFIVINIASFNKVKIPGFGILRPHFTPPRVAYIPFLKEKRELPAKLKVSFKEESPFRKLLQSKVDQYIEIFNLKPTESDGESID